MPLVLTSVTYDGLLELGATISNMMKRTYIPQIVFL